MWMRSGSLPPSWGDFRRLQTLGLQGNRLVGRLPDSLANLATTANVTSILLQGNRLTGVHMHRKSSHLLKL